MNDQKQMIRVRLPDDRVIGVVYTDKDSLFEGLDAVTSNKSAMYNPKTKTLIPRSLLSATSQEDELIEFPYSKDSCRSIQVRFAVGHPLAIIDFYDEKTLEQGLKAEYGYVVEAFYSIENDAMKITPFSVVAKFGHDGELLLTCPHNKIEKKTRWLSGFAPFLFLLIVHASILQASPHVTSDDVIDHLGMMLEKWSGPLLKHKFAMAESNNFDAIEYIHRKNYNKIAYAIEWVDFREMIQDTMDKARAEIWRRLNGL